MSIRNRASIKFCGTASFAVKGVLQLAKAVRLLLAAAVCTAALLPSIAADMTVSVDTTLTADTTVDALTVDPDVTLDLNGFSLTCSSLAGNGTITSTRSDLTSPDTDGTHVTSSPATLDGNTTPQNLFNNNYERQQDSTHRILLATTKLPLAVTYDFGEGSARRVDAYKVYYNNVYKARNPKAWLFEGSNDGDVWNQLDSRDNETDWTASRTYTCTNSVNTGSYRFYRITFTASNDGVGSGKYLEFIQLEYFNTDLGPGELHVNVADGETVDLTVKVTDDVKMVKEGGGTIPLGNTLINNGTIVVNGGTVSATALHIGELGGDDGLVEVNGGTLSVPNNLYIGYRGTGTLTISSGTVEVDSGYTTMPAYISGSRGTINLNGGILKTKRIAHHVGSGTINFNGGTLQANDSHASDLQFIKSGMKVNVCANGGTIDNGGFDITIPAALDGYGSLTLKGSGTTTLSGSVDNYSGAMCVAAGSTPLVSKNIATKLLSNGLVLAGAPELNTPYTILASSSESDDWSSLSLSKITCPVASEITTALGEDGKSIVVTVTSLKSGNFWTGDKNANLSDPGNWSQGVVPAAGADIDLSAATTVNADLDRTFGRVTMGVGIVTFTGSFAATSFSDTEKIFVAADSTVTVVGDLSFYLSSNRNICHWVGDGGKFEVTGDIKATGGSRVLNPCYESVGTGVVAAKGLVNNASDNYVFRLVRNITGYHANWLIGEHGLSGNRKFAVSSANNTTTKAKIIAATDFPVLANVQSGNGFELDTAGQTVTIAAGYQGTDATTFSGSGTVAVASGVDLGTGGITLGGGTTLALTADSGTFTALKNALSLPATGTAAIRINGSRLRSGDHVIANVASGVIANVELDASGAAIGGRTASLRIEDGKLILNITSSGFILIFK